MTPLVCEAVKLAPEPETALWFDVGMMEPIFDKHVPADVVMNLPFKRTGIAGVDSKGRKFSLWLTAGENSVTVAGCTITPTQYFEPFAYILTNEGMRYYNHGKEVTQDEILPVLRMVYAVLLKLAGKEQAYKATPQRTFINQKRKAKGKSALSFDWHTVEIEPPKAKNDSQGGTHATPRRHQVRGHWRTYKSGKRGWVRECWKGDASKGIIFKDYKIKELP